jgi:hypothetical protein
MTSEHLAALDRARQRMARAKQEFTLASQAVHRREPGAAERADRAIAEMTAARRELNALLDAEPASPWTEMARVREERGDA